MRQDWINACFEFSQRDEDFYSGCRKIHRNVGLRLDDLKDDLTIQDCGFTKVKLTLLRKLYLHQESRDMAVQLWERRLKQGKYGSVGFTCFNHLLKADPNKKSKRASVMGPCLQSVNLTLMPGNQTAVNVFYRTTELFKKFPADLVFLRDELLAPFNLPHLFGVHFTFANLTCHPMYMVTLFPLVHKPTQKLEKLKAIDRRFYDWTVKWTARYICDEYTRGIEKFAQAMRVRKDALERIDPRTLRVLQDYVKKNHPGHRNEYQGDDEDE